MFRFTPQGHATWTSWKWTSEEKSQHLTLRWSTDQLWTWEQGLTNASLLVGETLSKNSWRWANLLCQDYYVFSNKHSSILQNCFKYKYVEKAWKLVFFTENWQKRVLNLQNYQIKGPGLATGWCRLLFSSECKGIAMHNFFWDTLGVKESLCTIFSGTPCI